jgi:hypothetical protein
MMREPMEPMGRARKRVEAPRDVARDAAHVPVVRKITAVP